MLFTTKVLASPVTHSFTGGPLLQVHSFNESDESVVKRWVKNPYWSYFVRISIPATQTPLTLLQPGSLAQPGR